MCDKVMLIVVSVIDIIPSIACGVSALKTKHNGGDISVTNLTERENTLTSLEARCGNPRAGDGGFQGGECGDAHQQVFA
jgi:hypothetical protein